MADSRLPERADALAKAGLRKADRMAKASLRTPETRAKADREKAERRAVTGAVLCDALVILGITRLKQQAEFLGTCLNKPNLDPRQVARWFDGTEGLPWDDVLTNKVLLPTVIEALAKSIAGDLVEIRTVITRKVAA